MGGSWGLGAAGPEPCERCGDASGCGELLPWPIRPSWNYICLLKRRRFPCRDFPASQTKRCLEPCWPWKKPLRASECARCAPCAASAPLHLAAPPSSCAPCLALAALCALWSCFCFASPGTGLWEGFCVNIHAPRCTGALRESTEVLLSAQPWGTCGAVPPLPLAMHFKPLAEPSSSAFEHLGMAACWCRDRWNWNTPCPGRSHLQD